MNKKEFEEFGRYIENIETCLENLNNSMINLESRINRMSFQIEEIKKMDK